MLRRLANLAALAALSLATVSAPARAAADDAAVPHEAASQTSKAMSGGFQLAAVHVGNRGAGHQSRVVAAAAASSPAPTYLPTVSVAPILVAFPQAKMVEAYNGPLVNAYNAGRRPTRTSAPYRASSSAAAPCNRSRARPTWARGRFTIRSPAPVAT